MPESFPAPDHGLVVTHFLTVRDVAVSRQFYADVFGGARGRGAQFLTEPQDRGSELRCYLRDPDGYLVEIGQTTGLLHLPPDERV
jgi:catechol 2,3-dioxygenase-like lactoylglutathione lyase family enzyme